MGNEGGADAKVPMMLGSKGWCMPWVSSVPCSWCGLFDSFGKELKLVVGQYCGR